MSHPVRCEGPLSRRRFLRMGSLALAGRLGSIPAVAAPGRTGRKQPDTSVILLWLPGGPPHMETFDMKPDAPAEYRGDFRPIKTNVPGIDVCELLPRHANRLHIRFPTPALSSGRSLNESQGRCLTECGPGSSK